MRHAAWLVCAAAIAICTGCAELTPAQQDAYARGETALSSEDWGAATAAFSEVIASSPQHAPSLVLRGRARFELAEYDEALKDLDSALASRALEPPDELVALLYSGRCYAELGDGLYAEDSGNGSQADVRNRRDARTSFLKAGRFFARAIAMAPTDYESHLWRAYGYSRLENYRKAIVLLGECARLAPDRWEHRFFKALALEGIYGVNAESINALTEIASAGSRLELLPLYLHLVEIHSEVGGELQRRIFTIVDEFASRYTAYPDQIDQFLIAARAKMDEEQRGVRVRDALVRARDLTDRQRFEEALDLLDGIADKEGVSAELSRVRRDVRERWSRSLEADAVTLSNARDKQGLERALESYLKAQTLTIEVDRLGTLQQKIDAIQLALRRRKTSVTIQRAYDSLRVQKFAEVLETLRPVSLPSLSGDDRDVYYYLLGTASFRLKRWRAATRAFEQIAHGNFQDLSLLHGKALVRSGQTNRGLPLLLETPESERDDVVHRVLGAHFAAAGELAEALLNFERLEAPKESDHEAIAKAHRTLGDTRFAAGAYTDAAKEYNAARDVTERSLHRRASDLWLLIGHCYFRAKDFDRAKKTYDDLANSQLSERELERGRDLFLYRARIHLMDQEPELAYRDLAQFARLKGTIADQRLSRKYARLTATYANFMPLEVIDHWKYTNTATGTASRLLVKKRADGAFDIERHEGQAVTRELWRREGTWLVQEVGKDIWRIPVSLDPAADENPSVEYERTSGDVRYAYKASIEGYGESVSLPGQQTVENCLRVQLSRTSTDGRGRRRFFSYSIFLAPDLGEVKREVVLDGARMAEIVLSGFAMESDLLGN